MYKMNEWTNADQMNKPTNQPTSKQRVTEAQHTHTHIQRTMMMMMKKKKNK